jgi:ribosomal protein S12 methylthiotransferase
MVDKQRIQGFKGSGVQGTKKSTSNSKPSNPGHLEPWNPSCCVISLGCAKNRVDSEIMLHQLQARGFSLTDEPKEAEVILVNTCSFIESATQESIETIFEASSYKKEGACQALVVTGCFPQRYGRQLVRPMPEVDLFLGTESFSQVADQITDFLNGKKHRKIFLKSDPAFWTESHQRLLTTTPGTAYLKIAEGCSNHCAYCTIPSIRGPLQSRDPKVLVREAEVLAGQGVHELILIGQDTTSYGTDLKQSVSLIDLIQHLLKIDSFEWLRLLYLRPERVSQDLLDLIARGKRICPYLDIPIQHVSDHILKRMNRTGHEKALRDLFERIRKTVPWAALRTTLMVGFPGETDRDFKKLLDFISEVEFDHLGVFQYSREEGTPAVAYPDQVPEEVSRLRYNLLMERQKEISLKKNLQRIGAVEPVLVTGLSPESDLLIQGRTRFQAPEADGVVYITEGEPKIGRIQKVKITAAHAYDLVGVLVGEKAAHHCRIPEIRQENISGASRWSKRGTKS